ncbi:hypothetical protein [Salinisphaera dokdonensis]|uniref:hypothetical protein n=1 Tax=Salinisphaera dokdonensis TaxID=454598 RepID=UPI00333EB9DE
MKPVVKKFLGSSFVGALAKQFGGVVKRILRMSLPHRRKGNTLTSETSTDAPVYAEAA